MAPFGQLTCLTDVSQIIVLLFVPRSTFSHGLCLDYSKVIISPCETSRDLRWEKWDWDWGWANLHALMGFFHVWMRGGPLLELFKIISTQNC